MEENLPTNNTPPPQGPVEVPVAPIIETPKPAKNYAMIVTIVVLVVIFIAGISVVVALVLMNNGVTGSNKTINPFKKSTEFPVTITLSPTPEATTYLPTTTPYQNPFSATDSTVSAENPFNNTSDNPFNNLQ